MAIVEPVLVRCTECRRWASVYNEEAVPDARCGNCGASVAIVDQAGHMASLPKRQDSDDDKQKMAHQLERQRAAAATRDKKEG